jgi:hypothetical protein
VSVDHIMSRSLLCLCLLLTLIGCLAPSPPPPLPARIVDMDVSPDVAYVRVVAAMQAFGGESLYDDPDTGLLLAMVQQTTVLYVKVMPWTDGTCGVYVRGRGRGSALEDYADLLQDGRTTPAPLARKVR